MPVAVLKDRQPFFIYGDHLNAPRAIADTTGKVVWRWEGDPFGTTSPDEDPDRDRKTFTYNLRLPGQYFDLETGLMYNYFRHYDPRTGRYIQADPIGLAGGTNPYNYVLGNSVNNIDPYGLASDNSPPSTPDSGINTNVLERAIHDALRANVAEEIRLEAYDRGIQPTLSPLDFIGGGWLKAGAARILGMFSRGIAEEAF